MRLPLFHCVRSAIPISNRPSSSPPFAPANVSCGDLICGGLGKPIVIRQFFLALALSLSLPPTHAADWPTLHGNPEHTGRSEEQLQFPLTLQWALEIQNERFSTAAEPFVTGNVITIKAQSANIYAFDTNGESTSAGLSGSKSLGQLKIQFNAPTRQHPAFSDDRIYVTSEDLRLHCLDRNWKPLWTSEQIFGQTARDYYPVIVHAAGKKFVIVRTNPVLNMAKQIAGDRNFLTKQAGIDASDWKKLDAWIKSPAAAGSPDLIAREQDAIVHYLETNQWAQTFYVFDAETGQRAFTPPIMWVGGCQGVGTPPAITKEGKAVVLYRSAYGNWNRGVAPLVAIGLLNFETGRIEPLRHNQGAQPPWNTFWGTADEEQNFTLAGDDLIIVHQGTLARFNLKTHDLEKIWGERDTYGGFKNPPWARNEWHGPGRGGVAISNGRVYWITGSRLLCLGPEKPAAPPTVKTLKGSEFTLQRAARPSTKSASEKYVTAAITESLSETWAPLYVEPGLAGREFFFADSREIFTAYAYAFPHLQKYDQSKVKKQLTALFESRPPFATNAVASLAEGERREYFQVPPHALTRLGNDKPSHRFGGVYSAYLYAERCNAWPEVLKSWPEIQSAFDDFTNKNPNFGQKPELYFNRYLASLLAYEKISARANSSGVSAEKNQRTTTTSQRARSSQEDGRDERRSSGSSDGQIKTPSAEENLSTTHNAVRAPSPRGEGWGEGPLTPMIQQATTTLLQWWRDAGTTLTNFNGSQQLDSFIQKGDKLSWAVFPHRHKLAIFQDMTPEIGDIIRREAPEAADQVWATFTNLAPTWYLIGEERQYHFGENFIDTPDFALSAFQALAFVQKANAATLIRHIDIPFCKADLYQIQKLTIALEAPK